MAPSTIKPWPELVRLRPEVRDGALSMEEFAANLYDVMAQTGQRPLYEDPTRFFSLTYATPALREIAAAVAERLRGASAKGIRQLEMTYGGGKTHTMVTLTHLVRDPTALPALPAVQEFESSMGGKAPRSRIAAVCFDKIDAELGCPVLAPDGTKRSLFQPWSLIAWQLAGADGLRMMRADGQDAERDTPPSDLVLEDLLNVPAKAGLGVLLLMDEVMMWVSDRAKHPQSGDYFFTQFENFLQSLTQAVAKVPQCALVVSLLASDPKKDDTRGRELLARMSAILKRTEDEAFLPVGRDDVAEVLRRRLLDPDTVQNKEAFRANVVAAVRALAALDPDFAKTPAQRAEKEKAYLEAFPFDPALMDVFYSKWTSGLPLFQRTRGVLRTFAVALKEAEAWDTSPIAGVSVLLPPPGQSALGTALRELAGVARTSQTEGEAQSWTSIVEKELEFSRTVQEGLGNLAHRELEAAVLATFLHSQPPGKRAALSDLRTMVGAGKPDAITLSKALGEWAGRSWYLDEEDLSSGAERPDGTRELPRTWRMGDQPNLKQMHDDARQFRVSDPAVEEKLLELVRADAKLKAGAGPGTKSHMLPAGPGDVTDDGDFHFAVLGPSAACESGKPSAEAVRFVDQTTGADKPRVSRNALVLGVPSAIGLAAARDRIRDHLAWLEVRKLLAGQPADALRSAKLQAGLKTSEDEMRRGVRQAWCIGVATAADDTVKAFKVTLDENKTLFQSIKDDKDARIQDTALDPDLILPGSTYDLWREEEPSQRVKTLVGAFFERSKLPKMLRRKELLDTVANGAEQGRFVLRLSRPDGSMRTWWRDRPEDVVLAEAGLEAVQTTHAELADLAAALLRPGVLPGLDFAAGVKVADLLAYFGGGHSLSVKQTVGGVEYDEIVAIPKCGEAKVLGAVAAAVQAGHLWVTNGPMSFCGEEPPAGAIAKTAVLRVPPSPIPLTSLTPEALPDAWSGDKATLLALQNAASAKFAPAAAVLPWLVVSKAVNDALNARYLELVPGGAVAWPCEAQAAALVEVRLPTAGAAQGASGSSAPGDGVPGFAEPRPTGFDPGIAEAKLDSGGLTALADALADVQAEVAAYGTTLVFRVSVEAAGLPPDARVRLRAELAKAVPEFGA
jgi:hypothetical protein